MRGLGKGGPGSFRLQCNILLTDAVSRKSSLQKFHQITKTHWHNNLVCLTHRDPSIIMLRFH
jgi:hypothetical protein